MRALTSLLLPCAAALSLMAIAGAAPGPAGAPGPVGSEASPPGARRAMARAPREVHLWVARDAAPGRRVRLTINTRNVPVVRLAAHRLAGASWLIRRPRPEQGDQAPPARPPTPGAPLRSWQTTLASRGEPRSPAQRDVYRSREINLPPLPPGVYLLTAAGGGTAERSEVVREAWAVVNITHLAVTVKRAPRRLLAWVCDQATGAPLSGARVGLYERDGTRRASGTTRADGTCLLSVTPGRRQTIVVEVDRSTPGGPDVAAVPSALEDPDGVLQMHFQTDRPIYRPGHTVFYKAILRRTAGQGYDPVTSGEAQVEVRDARDNILSRDRVSTNDVGTLAGQVELPPEGVPGPYTVAISVGKEVVYGGFTVAQYRKPEFKVTLRPAERRYLAGEPVAIALEAAYYFGAPVPQAEVTYQIRRDDSPYAIAADAQDWYAGGDGNLYPRDAYATQPFVAEGTLHTDENGRVLISFRSEKEAPDSSYQLHCTVRDASRRAVEASASVPVYAASLRLALATDVLCASLGSVVPLRLASADLDGRATPARVTLSVRQPFWVEKEGRYRYRELTRTSVSIPAAGRAAATVPAAAPGALEIRATARDATGRATEAALTVWVLGPGARTERVSQEPAISVRPDRRSYRAGEVAGVWVTATTGRAGRAEATVAPRNRPPAAKGETGRSPTPAVLLTAEGGDLWRYAVVPGDRLPFRWRLPLRAAMSPNAYVTASQWVRGQFASDEAILPLPDPGRQLSVRVEPERTGYQPGEAARYRVRTADRQGRPVAAEVAFSVVDEAIFALRPDTTPDLMRHFWGRRSNRIVTQISVPEELSGGAYQRSEATAPVRQQFLDTAYWNAHVTTGADGTALVTVPLPGNLTAWRATARAVTVETRVGATTTSIRVSRPVMLRLAPPRQVVQGDHVTLVGTLHNRTEQEREFKVTLATQGLTIEEEPSRQIRIPAGGESTIAWKLSADEGLPESGLAWLEGRAIAIDPASGPELSDALRVSLRVLPRGIAQQSAVGGLLAREQTLTLTLPADRIEPATTATITVAAGLREAVRELAGRAAGAGPNGSLGAANQLLAGAAIGNPDRRAVRNAVALLSRFQQGAGGWGWWDDDPSDPLITARVLRALAAARAAGLAVPEALVRRGIYGAAYHYRETNLWEYRALLAAAITLARTPYSRLAVSDVPAGDMTPPAPQARSMPPPDPGIPIDLEEVRRRGTHLSPYVRLLFAEALLAAGERATAGQIAAEVTAAAVVGPDTAYLPGGEHPGWSATSVETTAEALLLLVRLDREPPLQRKLAEWLARPNGRVWRSQDEAALTAYALAQYLRRHPDPTRRGFLEISVNGVPVAVPQTSEGEPLRIPVPRRLLKEADNRFTFRRVGEGEGFVTVEARCYRPATEEAGSGIRVLRRLEARTTGGVWEELRGPMESGEILRCTVLVWPEARADAIRVTEPIPAGTEFLDSEAEACAREEVRDGAVIHYLRGDGRPVSFRYYLRTEAEGEVVALPAVAEALRQPDRNGHSAAAAVTVRGGGGS